MDTKNPNITPLGVEPAAPKEIEEMTEEDKRIADAQLNQILANALQKQFLEGMKKGIYVCSKVVLDKLTDTSKPLVQRISEVKKYCRVANNNPEMAEFGLITKQDENIVDEDIKENDRIPELEEEKVDDGE